MVNKLGFASYKEAKKLRDEYFERYHSTAKALTVAEAEGRLPTGYHFDTQDLAEWWATNLDFNLLGGPSNESFQKDLKECSLTMVAFSNGPGKYAKRVLKELGLADVFGWLFSVDDVLPYCKPEPEAFQCVFDKVGCKAEECVMIEDSMKNIRMAKQMGMKTVLVMRKGRSRKNLGNVSTSLNNTAADDAEATKLGDAPVENDPAVDVCIETVDELRSVLPGLWQSPPVFEPTQSL
jgi:putative hydrolase of the HAD superfamily